MAFFTLKKRRVWIWKAYCRTTKQLIDWEGGARNAETFRKMYERLKKWNVKVFFSDRYSVYRDFIPSRCLIQTKPETHLVESDNFPQRHWFARFRRKTCCVSRSIEMIDLTMFLYAAFHVNKSDQYGYLINAPPARAARPNELNF